MTKCQLLECYERLNTRNENNIEYLFIPDCPQPIAHQKHDQKYISGVRKMSNFYVLVEYYD